MPLLRPIAGLRPQCSVPLFVIAGLLLTLRGAAAAPPAPVTDVRAVDHPNDVGTAIDVSWTLSVDDDPAFRPPRVMTYTIYRKRVGDEDFIAIGQQPYQTTQYTDTGVVAETLNDQDEAVAAQYLYAVTAESPQGEAAPLVATLEPATPTMQFVHRGRAWLAIIIAFVCGAVVVFIQLAKSGYPLYVRPIPGLEAVDEAVGRATEMGRSCLFIPGIQDINDIQTVAGITVLSRVAARVAEYDAELEVPTGRSLVMTTARETVEAAYLAAGRPDAYNADKIYYLTDDQFGYVAAVTGTMVRDQPAACFYMGAFYAESLLFAENGNAIGAVQIAGTAMPSQLPFFVAACDYTLIGEEFFAASAYLSGEPAQLGSLRGQDLGKVFGAALIVIGCAAATLEELTGYSTFGDIVGFLQNHMLGERGFLP